VGEGTAAGRAQVLSAREEVLAARAGVIVARADMESEIERLEAAARAALDVKAKVRRNPARVAGAAAGIGFVAVGGPRRVIRGTRNAIFGKPKPLPKAMLPNEIEAAVKALGDDGDKVRGALERNFAAYLEQNAPERHKRDLRSQLLFLGLPAARVLILRFGRQFIEEALATQGSFDDQLARVRARRSAPKPEGPEAP
jgi:hypothetical protein